MSEGKILQFPLNHLHQDIADNVIELFDHDPQAANKTIVEGDNQISYEEMGSMEKDNFSIFEQKYLENMGFSYQKYFKNYIRLTGETFTEILEKREGHYFYIEPHPRNTRKLTDFHHFIHFDDLLEFLR